MARRSRWLPHRSPADLPLTIILFTVGLSLVVSPSLARSLQTLPPLGLGLVFFFLLAKYPWSAQQLNILVLVLLLFQTFICLLALVGMEIPRVDPARWLPFLPWLRTRLSDTFNPNVIAGLLLPLLPFNLAFLLSPQEGEWLKGRFPYVLHLCLCFYAAFLLLLTLAVLWLSNSRSAYLALAAALLLFGVILRPRLVRWLLLAAIVTFLLTGTAIGWPRFAEGLLAHNLTYGLPERLEIWSHALAIIADFPFTGIGLGCFEPVVASLYPLQLTWGGTAPHAHNLFLQIGIDLGLPGLAAFLVLLGLTFWSLFRAYQAFVARSESSLRLLAAALLASLTGAVFHGLFDCALWNNKGAFLLWFLLGLGFALHRLSISREPAP